MQATATLSRDHLIEDPLHARDRTLFYQNWVWNRNVGEKGKVKYTCKERDEVRSKDECQMARLDPKPFLYII